MASNHPLRLWELFIPHLRSGTSSTRPQHLLPGMCTIYYIHHCESSSPCFYFCASNYRNGHEFEQRIKQNEVNNPKFNFLNPGDPYHAYYQHRVVEIREGKDEQKQEKKEKTAKAAMAGGERPAGQATAATEAMKQRQSELLKQAQKEQEPAPPSEPPPGRSEECS